MSLHLVGYFPKITTTPPDGWEHPIHVTEICSVSTCLARAPEHWIDKWLHNEFGFFNTLDDASSVLPSNARDSSIFAYRVHSQYFIEGNAYALEIPSFPLQPLPPTFASLGFDAVSKSISDFMECSPLSCNGEVSRFAVNEYCLFSNLHAAIEAAKEWSVGGAEPGDYYIFEVLRPKSTGDV